jgi:peptidoglycan/xylan/chitin deacetylase (PgdA/CDA1 family)
MAADRPHDAGVLLDRAAFVISIDLEMAWGVVDRRDTEYDVGDEREQMRRLLDLFDHHDVPATWATVGHLLLDECHPVDGVKHPELVRPGYSWLAGDWLDPDPCSTYREAPAWYAPDLIREIRARPARHEIGSHSFTHLLAGDPGCSGEAFGSDLDAASNVMREQGTPLRSFVYPRNQYGHEHLLREHGVTSFRGRRADPFRGRGRFARSTYRLVDRVRPLPATVVRPYEQFGVWNLPATYLYTVRSGWRAPVDGWQARRRLDQAVRHRGLFHLWFHPHNARQNTEAWFAGLDDLLERVTDARRAEQLDTFTMVDLADRLGALTDAT